MDPRQTVYHVLMVIHLKMEQKTKHVSVRNVIENSKATFMPPIHFARISSLVRMNYSYLECM